MSRGIKSNVDVGKSWGAYFQLWVRLIVEINVVVDGGLVLQTVKTDMVKHDVEVESLGKCVDEIDKPTELTGKHEADQHCLNGFRESQFKHNPKLVTPSSVMEGQAIVAASDVPGDGSRVHTHDHDGSEALDVSSDSILSSEPKPLGKHMPPPPPSILSPVKTYQVLLYHVHGAQQHCDS
ncbi:hypothetical protein Tco_0122428 [Tanacetum coccineum]